MKKWPRKGKLRDKKSKEEGMKPTGKVEQLKSLLRRDHKQLMISYMKCEKLWENQYLKNALV